MQRITRPVQQTVVAAHAHLKYLSQSNNNDAVRPRLRRMPATGPTWRIIAARRKFISATKESRRRHTGFDITM